MKQLQSTDWQAQWIWNNKEASPRNEWWCFRKTFEMPSGDWDNCSLTITADSRYALYVNGEQVGRGPVRSWPSELAYDTYEIGHLLHAGRSNTIAVLVMSFGVANFYYLLGRGGLLAQLEIEADAIYTHIIATDSSWLTSRHLGQDSRSPRMACQQAFAERIDARAWNSSWIETDYDDSEWEQAVSIGSVGMEPWSTLIPRDIPLLTEEVKWPVRVESLSKVKPIDWTTMIDVRNHLMPDSISHANPVCYVGYIATLIRTEEAVKATIGFPNCSALKACSLNGEWLHKDQYTGEMPERYAQVQLERGDNLLLLDVSVRDHARGLQIGIDCDAPFELISPLGQSQSTSSFVSIGPFSTFTYIDHQNTDTALIENRTFTASPFYEDQIELFDESAFPAFQAFNDVRAVQTAADLHAYRDWIQPIPLALVSQDSIFSLCVWKKDVLDQPVPLALQDVVIASSTPAIVPLYDGADTEFIIDFGMELSGYLTFEVDASEGTILDFYGYEYMRDGWRQDTFDLENTLRYVCTNGRQSYTSYVRRGLRYLMVTVRDANRPAKVYGIKMLQSNYPVAEIGKFQSSDALLNDIWQISKHTTRLCMEDTFVDCPAYEQVFWVGDSRNEALVNFYVFGATEIVERCLRLVPGSSSQTPLFADQVPSGWSSVIPNWTFFWVVACCEYYQHTGDEKFAKDLWPHIHFTLQHYLQKLDDRGLFYNSGWNLLDWAPIDQPNNGVITHQNLFLVKTLHHASQLAEIVGEAEEAILYVNAADSLTASINEHLWSEERQAYLDCIHEDGQLSRIFSMQTQVTAYLCDVAGLERASQIERYLLSPPTDFVQIGSPFMSFFYYEALAKMGNFEAMLKDMRFNYGQMIEYDATTCWEMYPNFSENRPNPNMLSRSHCHAWSAAPGYFLGAHILGVTPESAGWRKVNIAPKPSGLQWARGTVPLPQEGRIDVAWRITSATTMHLQVWAPSDIELDIVAPEGFECSIERHLVVL